jgi:Schlafen, AlbA_2
MRVNGKLVTLLTEDDLNQLIDDGRQEDEYLDYKRDAYGKTDADKRELLKDVAGLANAVGGVILIGIEEGKANVPIDIPGVEPEPNQKDPMERYERTIRDGIEPRLVGVRIEAIPLRKEKRLVIAIGVPQSLNRPHRVKTAGSERWTIRHNRDTIDMTYTEIRSAFLDMANIVKRVRDFQIERDQDIAENNPKRAGLLAVHLAPLSTEGRSLDVQKALLGSEYFFPPGLAHTFPLRPNLDGVTSRGQRPHKENEWGWFQLHRDGRIEGVFGNLVWVEGPVGHQNRRLILNYELLENCVFESLPAYVSGLVSIGFNPPFGVALSLIRAQGSRLHSQPPSEFEMEAVIAPFDPVIIESAELTGDWHSFLQPIFDQLWNGYGYPACPSFDDNGIWKKAVLQEGN